jgi:hypothetical protein
MTARRRCLSVISALGLFLLIGCAHKRGHASTDLALALPPPPTRGHAALSDAARRAQDKIDSVRKQFEKTKVRPHQSGNDRELPLTQIGSGPGRAASTTGVVPAPSSSGAWSSVASEAPAPRPRTSASTAGEADAQMGSERAWDGRAVQATIVACVLVAAIIWLPRRLHQ